MRAATRLTLRTLLSLDSIGPSGRLKYLAPSFAVLLGCAALANRSGAESPEPLSVDVDSSARPTPAYRILPDAPEPLSADDRLEDNLAAFAESVEARRAAHPDVPPPLGFDDEALDTEISEILDELDNRAEVSVHMRHLGSDAILFDYFGDRALNPASNHKILTGSAALDLLGPDYRFSTRFVREDATLFVIGQGDPTLDTPTLAEVAARIADEVQIAGLERIVVDDSAFSAERFGPGYSSRGVGAAYQAPSGALSLAFNTVQVTVYPVSGSRRAGVAVYPESTHLRVINRARVGGERSRLAIQSYETGGETVIEVTGNIAKHAPPVLERRRVYDPGLYTGGALAHLLAEASGTEALEVVAGRAPATGEEILVHESEPLLEIVDDGLAWSNNFIAEQLLRTTAWRMTGTAGNWDDGMKVLEGYWAALGHDPRALRFENGSGFSSRGRASSQALVDLISAAYRVQDSDEGLVAALPVAGADGTLKTRLRSTDRRVRAKTGTLRGVSGLSGVITDADGEAEVAFSILINVREGTMAAAKRRRVEDRIVLSVLRHLDASSPKAG